MVNHATVPMKTLVIAVPDIGRKNENLTTPKAGRVIERNTVVKEAIDF